MSEGLNRVTLLGNLGADPELRMTGGGQAILNLRLATTESFLDRNRVRQERTDWHRVVVFGGKAEALGKILQKGKQILVEGRIQTRSYEDAGGQKRYQTDIVAQNVVLCGSRADAQHRDADGGSSDAYGQRESAEEEQPWADQF